MLIQNVTKGRYFGAVVSSLLSFCVGLVVSLLVLLFLAGNPLASATDFFTGVFASGFYLGTMFDTAALFMWAAVGASLAIVSGSLNLGGEGQIYLSGFVAALVLGGTSLPAGARVILAGLASCLCGGISALIPAMLKRFRGSSELLTSFLFSALTIPLVDAAIAGPFRDSARNLLATPPVPENLRLMSVFPPSTMNLSFFVALVFCVLVWLGLFKTKSGKNFCLCGTALDFARYSGINVESKAILGMILSGCCHGLTGFFAVWGTYYTCHSGFYAGMGWNALSCALIARSNPLAVIPAAFLLSWIFTAVDRASMVNLFSFDMEGLIQGAMLFFISARFVWPRLSFLKKRRKNGFSS